MKILVIDDHPLFLDGLQQVLELVDEQVESLNAFSAEDAFALLQQDPSVELILVDFSLPGLDGVDFLQIQRERGLSVPIALISAHDDARMVHKALQFGASGFIPKSFRAAELLEAVHRIMAGEVFVPPYMARQVEQLRRGDAARRSGAEPVSECGVTAKQRQVIELLAKGLSNRNIALALNLSEHTVKSHLKTIYSVLHVESRTQCIKRAEQLGIIDLDRSPDQNANG